MYSNQANILAEKQKKTKQKISSTFACVYCVWPYGHYTRLENRSANEICGTAKRNEIGNKK